MIKIFNTLSGEKEVLKPRAEGKISLFVCGITPYDFPHIGNARTYVIFDAFVKYLRSLKYKVFYLQNVTDIDDKIIQRAKETNQNWKTISRAFEKEFLKEMKELGVTSVTKYARATDHIKEIISQVQRLLQKGYAYEIPEDGIYYDIKKFSRYGKLSGRTILQAEDAVSRIDESITKRNKGDFALWKFMRNLVSQKETKFLPAWDSPWGKGRPGWHIEDTAIAEKYFGFQYDLHGGGRDLLFPHHEAEVAQMEAISGKTPLASYWMHTGFLTVQGEKMSKSKKNFVTVADFLKAHSPRLMRFLFLKTHYRSPIDYSEATVFQVKAELDRVDEFITRLQNYKPTKSNQKITSFKDEFVSALEDDFNTPQALAVIFNLIRTANPLIEQGSLDAKDKTRIVAFLKEADIIFEFIFSKDKKQQTIPKEIEGLIQKREQLRKQGNWKGADELRKQIASAGWVIEDTPQGPRLKKQTQ